MRDATPAPDATARPNHDVPHADHADEPVDRARAVEDEEHVSQARWTRTGRASTRSTGIVHCFTRRMNKRFDEPLRRTNTTTCLRRFAPISEQRGRNRRSRSPESAYTMARIHTTCRMFTHPLGHELRLEVKGQLVESVVCRTDDAGRNQAPRSCPCRRSRQFPRRRSRPSHVRPREPARR